MLLFTYEDVSDDAKGGLINSMIKLKIDEFKELTGEVKDNELAKKMNISTTQLWRVRLPDEDPRHNDPGQDFVAGALKAFPSKKFEDLFFLS